ncbi:YqeG family HAD IIIA-type phosphatase [Tepidibacillus sp. LV47]|uniref:YqeG family HAD IIIA-type phosphatase n=1 Tax=Tepidibacillus sp. LV47 TaxID=3398228 RepID=UPI003AADFE9B
MLLKNFVPDLYVQSIYHIDLDALKKRGITSIITDLDNTLVEADSPYYTPKLVKWLDDLQEMGFKVIIVSNNNLTRVAEFADPLTVPYIHRARKPLKRAFKQALERLQSTVKETVVIGDQLLTDIFGGKRMGFYTILVIPISKKEKLGTKIIRVIERIIMKWLKRRGLIAWEDE